ncbi:CopG family ribbon-helix-helix protein [Mesorhizobium sp. IMUNJ 23232]|uniref:CopG family ribbon-helix-helix protein n=1 Tax=Mesorhizobium sp. IMUNJ 23232 TaxID=3376064 RepID=UPI0037BCB50A
MTDSTFTFRVDDDLKTAFAETAKAQDRTAAQLLRVLMREAVEESRAKREYDEWFDAEIDAALKEADDPNTEWVPHEVVKEDMARQRAELLARIEAEKK